MTPEETQRTLAGLKTWIDTLRPEWERCPWTDGDTLILSQKLSYFLHIREKGAKETLEKWFAAKHPPGAYGPHEKRYHFIRDIDEGQWDSAVQWEAAEDKKVWAKTKKVEQANLKKDQELKREDDPRPLSEIVPGFKDTLRRMQPWSPHRQ